MSEAVTNAEIEDVLSSIRRLVSENAMPDVQAAAPAPAPAPAAEPALRVEPLDEPPAVERLVLTPAFRVHEAAPEPAQDQEQEQAQDGAPEPMLLSDPISEPVVEEAPAELDTPDTPDIEEAALADLAWPDPTPELEVLETATAETSDAAEPAPESLEHRIAELEAVISDTPGDWEPDGSEVEPEEPQTVVFEHAAWSAREGDAVEEVEEAQYIEAEVPVEEAEVISISPAVEEPEVPEAAAGPEPVDDTVGYATGDAVDDTADDTDALFDETFDEAVIDEEVLREMVQKLVREELQGTVGERITRNVRRLVRREIQRALTLREFE